MTQPVYDGLGSEEFYGEWFRGAIYIRESEECDPPTVAVALSLNAELLVEEAQEVHTALGKAIRRAKARIAQQEARRAQGLDQLALL